MRATLVACAIAAVLVSIGEGQNTEGNLDRAYRFASGQPLQDFYEVATLMRLIVNLPKISAVDEQRTVNLRGTADQIGLADWLYQEMNRPGQPGQSLGTHEYRMGGDDVVRLFYVTRPGTIPEFQEMATAIRSVAEIRSVFTRNSQAMIALRATADKIAVAEWLFNELNQTPHSQNSGPREYRVGPNDIVRVFYLNQSLTTADFQKMGTSVRARTSISRTFAFNPARALILRGTVDQIALANQIIVEPTP
jgi:hypothetical protein